MTGRVKRAMLKAVSNAQLVFPQSVFQKQGPQPAQSPGPMSAQPTPTEPRAGSGSFLLSTSPPLGPPGGQEGAGCQLPASSLAFAMHSSPAARLACPSLLLLIELPLYLMPPFPDSTSCSVAAFIASLQVTYLISRGMLFTQQLSLSDICI